MASAFNQPISTVDPTAHAEIGAIRAAAQAIGNYRLTGATLCVTVEPCAMCVGAMVHARIGTLIYGAPEPKTGAVHLDLKLIDDPSWNHRIVGGRGSDGGGLPSAHAGVLQGKTKKEKRIMDHGVLLATLRLSSPQFAITPAQAPDAARIRAAFLQMIARPRVPLAPETQPRVDAGAYRARAVQLRDQRPANACPAFFSKSASANDRRPVVIFLHGTGSRKEEFLALMRTFADRGFATAAIDARHHGARIAREYGSGNAQYFAAMLETYRTGKGQPYSVRHGLGRDAARRLSRDAR